MNESDTVTLVCEVFGVPLPTVMWSVPEGTEVGISSMERANYSLASTLEINSVTLSNEGDYICTATNGVRNVTVEASAFVYVQGTCLCGNSRHIIYTSYQCYMLYT